MSPEDVQADRDFPPFARVARDGFAVCAEDVRHPRGSLTRFKLFDAPFDEGRERLIGQEEVQQRVYRVIANFVRASSRM